MASDLRHFEAFLAVARAGRFTAAAEVLHVSQPALTVQIRQLEQSLGVRLFDRTNRRVSITDAGRALLPQVERLLFDVDAVRRHAQEMTTHRRGEVAVAALPSVAASLLPVVIRRLVDRHVGLVVSVRDLVGQRIVDAVKSGEVDIGIGSLTQPDTELQAEWLFDDRLCAFACRSHALAAASSVTLRELSQHRLILTTRDSTVRQIVDRAFDAANLAPIVAQEATYLSTAIAMARAGLGVAVLPESTAAPGAMCVMPIQRPALRRQVAILSRRGRSLSPAAEALVALLRAQATAPARRRPGPSRRA